MSYQAIGLDVPALISRAQKLGTTALKVLEDPYLPELTCLVMRLNAIQESRDPGLPCKRTPKGLPGGIGLEDVITPVRIFAGIKQKPALGILGIILVLGGIAGLGYLVGKGKK